MQNTQPPLNQWQQTNLQELPVKIPYLETDKLNIRRIKNINNIKY